MNRLSIAAGLTLVVLFVWQVGPAVAQPSFNRGPATAPRYSPYLNLVRGGNPGLNYYGLVRPEFEFRNTANNLQQQIIQNRTAITTAVAGDVNTNLPPTGHGATFMNYSHFYSGGGSQISLQRPAVTQSRGPSTPAPRR